MKRFIKSKKGIALLATLVVAAAASVGAYAYLTTGGSGSGTATSGSTTNNLKIVGSATDHTAAVSVGTGILPGAANAVGVTYYIYNPNTYSVQVASVSASSITQSNTTCNTAPLNGDFSYTDGSNGYPATIPAGTTAGPFSGTLTESDDLANNQDSCEAPNVTTLNLTSN